MEKKFAKNTLGKRMGSMLRVDSRRMFLTPLFYIILGIIVAMPILILVMTGMMEGTPATDPQTQLPILDAAGNPVLREGFDSVWQIIGSVSGAPMAMDMVAMCNINLLYFGIAVLVSLFVSNDFKSGFCKNLFTVRAKKSDYIISKTLICVIASMILLLGFLVGSLLGGAVAGLPFAMEGFHAENLVMCILSKLLLMAVFVPIYLLSSVIAKSKTWLSMVLSFMIGMLLFTMIPMLSPLDATVMNVVLCAAGGLMFSFGLGAISRMVLSKKDIL